MKNFITYLALSAFLVVICCNLSFAQGMANKEAALPIIENISGMNPIDQLEIDNVPVKANDDHTIDPFKPTNGGGTLQGYDSQNGHGLATDEAEVSVYPNPARAMATIEVVGAENIQIEIFSVIGQVVKVEQTLGEIIVLNLDDVSAGIYLIRVRSNVGEFVKQIRVVK